MITVVWVYVTCRVRWTTPGFGKKRAWAHAEARATSNKLIFEGRERTNAFLASEIRHEATEATLLTYFKSHGVGKPPDVHLHIIVATRGCN